MEYEGFDRRMSDKDGITLAVLSQQIATLTAEVTAVRAELRAINTSATDYRIIQSRHDTEIINLGKDYDSLFSRVNGWSAANSFGVVVAAILALFFGNKNP
jgi:hypothetical protein